MRDPRYQLTSWFALDELGKYRAILLRNGIKLEKIWFEHEPEVVSQSYAVIDMHYRPLSRRDLECWLAKKTKYIEGFLRKWISAADSLHQKNITLVDYQEINQYLVGFLGEIKGMASARVRRSIDDFCMDNGRLFVKRSSPWVVQSKCLTNFIQEHQDLFIIYAERMEELRLALMTGKEK